MGTKKIKISQQRDQCIGCGSCVQYAACCWQMNPEDGKADLIGAEKKGENMVAEIDIDDLSANQEAAKVCPMQIIKIAGE